MPLDLIKEMDVSPSSMIIVYFDSKNISRLKSKLGLNIFLTDSEVFFFFLFENIEIIPSFYDNNFEINAPSSLVTLIYFLFFFTTKKKVIILMECYQIVTSECICIISNQCRFEKIDPLIKVLNLYMV